MRRDPSPWLKLSMVALAAAAVGNVVALLDYGRYYGRETANFVDQAIAQDLVNLFVVAPAVLVLGWLAIRGSLPALLAWAGFLTFTAYNYVLYVFSIHFGPLFLLWVAVWGASLFSLLGVAWAVDPKRVREAFRDRRFRGSAGFLLFAAALFGGLWLSEVVPALVDGRAPQSALDVHLPTNPVHVLDLGFFLPAVVLVGVSLWRARALGYVAGPALLLFLALTGAPILVTVVVSAVRGNEPAWTLLPPIGLITVSSLWLAVRVLRSVQGVLFDIQEQEGLGVSV